MKLFDSIFLSVEYLYSRKLRNVLTIVGISISLILITALVILGDGLKYSTAEIFNKYSPNMITITRQKGSGMMSLTFSSYFNTEDCNRLKARFKSIDYCGYVSTQPIFMSQGKTGKMVFLSAVNKKFLDNFDKIGFTLLSGSYPTRDNQVLLGYLFSKDNGVFPDSYKVGDRITLNHHRFIVSGILASVGDPMDDSMMYVTYDGAKLMFNKDPLISYLWLVTSTNPSSLVGPIGDYLKRKKHHTFNLLTTEAMLKKTNNILDEINYAILAIASLSLIVGAIGVSNSLFTSVEERKKDIGIMKAIGAKNSDIFLLILTETFIVSFVSMFIGIIVGYLLARVAAHFLTNSGFTYILHVNYLSILEIFVFDIILALLSAYAPAKEAANLNPIEAIRK